MILTNGSAPLYPGWLELSVSQWCLVISAGRAEEITAGSAVMSSAGQTEHHPALLAATCCPVRNPNWSSVTQSGLLLAPPANIHHLLAHLTEAGLPVPLLLHRAIESLQPSVPLVEVPGPEGAAPHGAGDGELRLVLRHQADYQAVQGDGVAHLQ